MNRELAETRLAALVADELDAPQRAQLLAYLKTDPVLAERLGDMRSAAQLVRAGLEQACDDSSLALSDAQRASLLALVQREPIGAGPADVPREKENVDTLPALPGAGVGVLFSFRVAGAAAACVAMGVGVIGLSLPDFGLVQFESMAATADATKAAGDDWGYGYGGADAAGDAVDEAYEFEAEGTEIRAEMALSSRDTAPNNRPRTSNALANARATNDRITRDASPMLGLGMSFADGQSADGWLGDNGLGDSDGDGAHLSDLTGLLADGRDLGDFGELKANWEGSVLWNDNHIGVEQQQNFQTRYGWDDLPLGLPLVDATPTLGSAFEQRRASVDFATSSPDSARAGYLLFDSGLALNTPNAAQPNGYENQFGDVKPDVVITDRPSHGLALAENEDLLYPGLATDSDRIAIGGETAPHFDLNEALSNTNPGGSNAGGGGGGGGRGTFGEDEAEGREVGQSPSNRGRGVDPLVDLSADRTIARQETAARYEQAMARAQDALGNKEHDAAIDAVLEARTLLNANRSAFNENERGELAARAVRMQSGINEARVLDEARNVAQAGLELSLSERQSVEHARHRRTQEVQERLRNARTLQLDRDYDAALDELDAALFIDPHNPAVQSLRYLLQDVIVATEAVQIGGQLDLMRSNQSLIDDEATIPYDELLTYPGEWPELTQMRLAGLDDNAAVTEANRTTQLAMRRLVTLNAENATLASIIDYLRDTTGANIAMNWPSLDGVGIERAMPISIALERAPADQLLKLVLEQAGAANVSDDKPGYAIIEGIVQISTLDDLRPANQVKLYDIRALLVGLDEQERNTAVADLIGFIQENIGDANDWADMSCSIRELNGNLIVSVSPDSQRDLAALLQRVLPDIEEPETQQGDIPPVNPWVLTQHDTLSTFALDTDTASYELARRTILEQAHLPAIASVRMEEFVNRFDYHYPCGRDVHDTFTVHAQAGDAPFANSGGDGVVLLKVGVRGRVVARDQMKPAHYVFVIDASGSMARADRLPLVQQSLAMLLNQLGEHDTVSLVSYDTSPFLLLEHAAASDPQTILEAVATIQTGGSTNLTDGLALGYEIAARHFQSGAVNRVILCSDGVANVGSADAQQMLDAVDAYRRQGVTLMTVGVGVDGQHISAQVEGTERFNDGLLEQLANRGDGRYLYLGSVEDAQRQLVQDLAATRPTIAFDAKIQVQFDPTRVRRYRLIGYENRDITDQDFRNDAIDAGEVGSGQSATALYEIELYPVVRLGQRGAVAGPADLGTVFVRYRDAASGQVRETATALSADLVQERSVRGDPYFYLAACAAEFAELLRESEHAADGDYNRLYHTARQVAEALPLDQDAAELAELIRRSRGLPRAGQ